MYTSEVHMFVYTRTPDLRGEPRHCRPPSIRLRLIHLFRPTCHCSHFLVDEILSCAQAVGEVPNELGRTCQHLSYSV